MDTVTVKPCKMWNLAVFDRGYSMAHVVEHVLPLKFFGLWGLSMTSTRGLPYFGNALPFVKHVLEASEEGEVDVPVFTVDREYRWNRAKNWRYPEGFLEISPRQDDKLVITIRIDYPGLGPLEKVYSFPDDELFLRIASAKSQAWPPLLYPVSRVLSLFGMWQHHDSAEWPQNYSPRSDVLERFADHRCLDILGALALLQNDAALSANVISICAGHIGDIDVCRQASNNLVPIG